MTNSRPYRAQPIDPKHAGPDGFVYGSYVFDGQDSWIIDAEKDDISSELLLPDGGVVDICSVIPSTVGQDTGETDKDKKKIWENDRVQPYAYRKRKDFIGTVVFEKGAYKIKGDGIYQDSPILSEFICRGRISNNELVVIRTIHDKK